MEYVDDDARLNKILIELGTEEVRLRNLSDKKELSAEAAGGNPGTARIAGQIRQRLETPRRRLCGICRASPEKDRRPAEAPGQGARRQRRNGPLLPHRGGTGAIRREECRLEIIWRRRGRRHDAPVEKRRTVRRGARGTWNCTKARPSWNCSASSTRKGFSVEHYAGQDEPLFEIREGEGDRETVKPLFSIPEILAAVKEIGRRGLSIKRFKGLGEMNAQGTV